jgi:hypothetical protein
MPISDQGLNRFLKIVLKLIPLVIMLFLRQLFKYFRINLIPAKFFLLVKLRDIFFDIILEPHCILQKLAFWNQGILTFLKVRLDFEQVSIFDLDVDRFYVFKYHLFWLFLLFGGLFLLLLLQLFHTETEELFDWLFGEIEIANLACTILFLVDISIVHGDVPRALDLRCVSWLIMVDFFNLIFSILFNDWLFSS